MTYRNGDLINVGEYERIVVDLRFGHLGRLLLRRIAGIREQFFVA